MPVTRRKVIASAKGALRGRGRVSGALGRNTARERELKGRLARARTRIAGPKGRLPNRKQGWESRTTVARTCYHCGGVIRKGAVMAVSGGLPFHPGCYAKAEREAERELRKRNGLFDGGGYSGAKRVTKIRPVTERATGSKGEIVGVQPGGWVKVNWKDRAKPTLIKRSEIKRGRYPNVSVNPGLVDLAANLQAGQFLLGAVKPKRKNPKKKWATPEEARKQFDRYNAVRQSADEAALRKRQDARAAHGLSRGRRVGNSTSDVRSPTRTSTEVRSPTKTSTWAKTEGNITVTGGAGRGATTRVIVKKNPSMTEAQYKARHRQIDSEIARLEARLAKEEKDYDTFDTVLGGSRKARQLRARIKKLSLSRPRSSQIKNPSLSSISQKFQGHVTNAIKTLKAASSAPSDLARVGKLVFLKLKDSSRQLRIPGAIACFDTREKLWIAGPRTPMVNRKAKPGQLLDHGEISEICYETAKSHVGGGKTYEYVHKFGEEGGRLPRLLIDAEGMPLIRGGSYRVTAAGIED